MDPRRYRGLPAFYWQCSIKCLEEEMKARRKSRAKSRVQFKDPTLRQAVRSGKTRDGRAKKIVELLDLIKEDTETALDHIRGKDWLEAAGYVTSVVEASTEIKKLIEEY